MRHPITSADVSTAGETTSSRQRYPAPVRLLAVGTANPPNAYSQEEFFALVPSRHPIVSRLVKATHIRRRYLYLPPCTPGGTLAHETEAELICRHREGAVELGSRALGQAMERAGARPEELGYLCCVTSTGFMAPSLSAMLSYDLALRPDCQRIDLVGMGCNGGLNGLNVVTNWAASNPGRLAVLLCSEVNTAMYCEPSSVQDWIVNSLFGDGAAAVVVRAGGGGDKGPHMLDFESHLAGDHSDAMRFNWCAEQSRWSFRLDRMVPGIVEGLIGIPVAKLLSRWGLQIGQIRTWVVHGGGPALVRAVQESLNLEGHALRHTTSVLRDFGNLSSGSFLFSLDRLQQEEDGWDRGDYGLMVTMGPGVTVETALFKW